MNVQKIIFEDGTVTLDSIYKEVSFDKCPIALIDSNDGKVIPVIDSWGEPEEYFEKNQHGESIATKVTWQHNTLPLKCIMNICHSSSWYGLGNCECISHPPQVYEYFLSLE